VLLLVVAFGLQVVAVVEVGVESAKATLIYSKMSVISFDSDVVL
jgi:hypothetical protein